MNEQEKRDLLVRLAEGVMGWNVQRNASNTGWILPPQGGTVWDSGSPDGWNPLENIADAWMLVDALRPRFRRVEVHAVDGEWYCMLAAGTSDVDECYPYSTEAPTAPLAICLAADAVLKSPGTSEVHDISATQKANGISNRESRS